MASFLLPSRQLRAHLLYFLCCSDISSLFSGEESLGRFLDLYLYHSQYINLKGVSRSVRAQLNFRPQPCFLRAQSVLACFDRIPYLAFLDLLSKGTPDANVSKKEKGSQAYLECVSPSSRPPQRRAHPFSLSVLPGTSLPSTPTSSLFSRGRSLSRISPPSRSRLRRSSRRRGQPGRSPDGRRRRTRERDRRRRERGSGALLVSHAWDP